MIPWQSTELLLIRHGQTEANAAQRFQGQNDEPLTPKGVEEIRRSSHVLQVLVERWFIEAQKRFRTIPPLHALCSDLGRTRATAEILLQTHQLGQRFGFGFTPTPALREHHVGYFQGRTMKQFEQEYPDLCRSYFTQYEIEPYTTPSPGPGAESRDDVAARLLPLFKQTIAKEEGLHIWVSHGWCIATILELLNVSHAGLNMKLGNGAVLRLSRVNPDTGEPRGHSPFAERHNTQEFWVVRSHHEVVSPG